MSIWLCAIFNWWRGSSWVAFVEAFEFEFEFDGDLFRQINKWHVHSVNLSSRGPIHWNWVRENHFATAHSPFALLQFWPWSLSMLYLWLQWPFCQPKVPAIYQLYISYYLRVLNVLPAMYSIWPSRYLRFYRQILKRLRQQTRLEPESLRKKSGNLISINNLLSSRNSIECCE